LTAEIFRKVQAAAREANGRDGAGREVVIRVHPEMAHHLEAEQRENLDRLQSLVARKVAVQAMPLYHREQYDLIFR